AVSLAVEKYQGNALLPASAIEKGREMDALTAERGADVEPQGTQDPGRLGTRGGTHGGTDARGHDAVTVTLGIEPQGAERRARIGAEEDQVRGIAFSLVVLAIEEGAGGSDVIRQDGIVAPVAIFEADRIARRATHQRSIGVRGRPERIRVNLGAVAVAAEVESQDGVAFLLQGRRQRAPRLVLAVVAEGVQEK